MINIRNDDVRIKCYKCGNQYEMAMMRMDPSSKNNLVCRNCLDRKAVATKDNPSPKPNPTIFSLKQEKKDVKKKEDMIEYFCKECRYNFKRASHLNISRCPYCGTDGTVVQKGSTDKIISDAAKMKDTW